MRLRDEPLSEALKGGNLPPLALEIPTASGPQKLTCWHTEGIFRLIQSIPSPKAEPFKRWLARVGYEREQEIENPELAPNRPAKVETPATAPSLMSSRQVMAPSEPDLGLKPSLLRPTVAHRDDRLQVPPHTPPTPPTPLIRRLTRRPVLVTFPIRVRGYSLVVKLHSSKVVSSVRF